MTEYGLPRRKVGRPCDICGVKKEAGIGNPCSFSVRGYESPDDRSGVYNTIRVNPRDSWAKEQVFLCSDNT